VGSAIHLFFLATYKEYIYVAIQLRWFADMEVVQ
jgi:hypothetical protein